MEIKKIEQDIEATEERLNNLKNLKSGYIKVFGEPTKRVGRGAQRNFPCGVFAGSTIQDSVTVVMNDGDQRTVKQIAKTIFIKATPDNRRAVSRALSCDRSKYKKEGKFWSKKI
jgi:hypothetical protein